MYNTERQRTLELSLKEKRESGLFIYDNMHTDHLHLFASWSRTFISCVFQLVYIYLYSLLFFPLSFPPPPLLFLSHPAMATHWSE